MIVSCHQPYFLPWPGFFFKFMRSDLMVLLDDVQFPLGSSWVSRNRIKTKDGQKWISVPVLRKGRSLQRINQVEIFYQKNWGKKHYLKLAYSYHHGPYFGDHQRFFEEILLRRWNYLVQLNIAMLVYLRDALGISTSFELSSRLGLRATGSALLVEVCQKTCASVYLSSAPGKKYIDEDLFHDAGVDVRYLNYHSPTYPQLWGTFLPNLSAVDLLFNCGPKSHAILAAC